MSRPTERLGSELRALRQFAGLTTRQLADKLGTSQSMVSRIETGAKLPTRPQVLAWSKVTGVDRETRERLVKQAEALYSRIEAWRDVLDDENRHVQADALSREKAATTVRNYQATVLPGLLQTQQYAEKLIPAVDLLNRVDHAAAVAGRMERQQVLLDPGRSFEFLIAESAFCWNPGLAEERLAEQFNRVAMLTALDTVDVAVLPLDRVGGVVPLSNFILYDGDDEHVSIEVPHGSVRLHDPVDVELYRRLYTQLRETALQGAEAISWIQRRARRDE